MKPARSPSPVSRLRKGGIDMRLTLSVTRFDPQTDAEPTAGDTRLTGNGRKPSWICCCRQGGWIPPWPFGAPAAAASAAPAHAHRRSLRLACQTLVREVAQDGCSLSIEPLPGFPADQGSGGGHGSVFRRPEPVLPWVGHHAAP